MLKKKCKKIIEDLVVKYARDILTDENINKIAKNTMKLLEEEKDNSIIKKLEHSLKNKQKEQSNLLSSLKLCDIDSVKQTIFIELENIDKEIKN